MEELIAEGKVRWLGLSNVDAALLRRGAAAGRVVAVQNRYSLMHRDDDAEVLPVCRELGIGYIPYFPLESGLLTGKYRLGAPAPEGTRLFGTDDGRLSDERLRAGREARGIRRRARSHAARPRGRWARLDPWRRERDRGATKPEQAAANAAAGAWELSTGRARRIELAARLTRCRSHRDTALRDPPLDHDDDRDQHGEERGDRDPPPEAGDGRAGQESGRGERRLVHERGSVPFVDVRRDPAAVDELDPNRVQVVRLPERRPSRRSRSRPSAGRRTPPLDRPARRPAGPSTAGASPRSTPRVSFHRGASTRRASTPRRGHAA